MFKFTQSSTERVEKQKVWQLYADTNSWSQWDKGVRGVRLAGPFAAGTQGVMEMQAGPALPFCLNELVEGKSFSVKAELGSITVSFGHVLQEGAEGVTITHSVEVQGEDERQVNGLGQNIAAGVPACLQNLLALAGGL